MDLNGIEIKEIKVTGLELPRVTKSNITVKEVEKSQKERDQSSCQPIKYQRC